MDKPVITLGVAGGSGSGKTTVVMKILEQVGIDRIAYLSHDSYYKNFDMLSFEKRTQLNFDHPDAFDNNLLIEHIKTLQQGKPADVPVYDFKTYSRSSKKRRVDSQPLIMIDGILLFADKQLRDMMNIKVFVDADADIRFIRRLKRDIEERDRTTESIISQYLATVRPMHLEFVEPSKRYADIIIPEGGFNKVAVEMLSDRLKALIMEYSKI